MNFIKFSGHNVRRRDFPQTPALVTHDYDTLALNICMLSRYFIFYLRDRAARKYFVDQVVAGAFTWSALSFRA